MNITKMTVEEALAFSDEWIRGVTLHEGSQGWRVVCWILAEEVRRRHGIGGELVIARQQRDELQEAIETIYDLRPFGKDATEYALTVEDIARQAIVSVKGIAR